MTLNRRQLAQLGLLTLGALSPARALLAGRPAPLMPPSPDQVAALLFAELRSSRGAWQKLQYLTDHIGARISGSTQLEQAVRWGEETLKKDGLEAVRAEPVMVPHWVRGEGEGAIRSPAPHPLFLLALGGSGATPPEGLTAEVLEANSIDEIRALGERARGKIVFINRQIERNGDGEAGYGAVAGLRYQGAAEASKLGAAAFFIRSLGTAFLRAPHTGGTGFPEGVSPIPAAAITAEDADLLHRFIVADQKPQAFLRLTCQMLPDAPSANVIGELRGREKPDEVVVIGAHLDSWDVGQGAIDDGAGCVAVLESLRALKKLNLRPRRTIRGVLFTNEENGLRGGRDYASRHQAELAKHVLALESDMGAGRPLGFYVDTDDAGLALFKRLVAPLAPFGIDRHEKSPFAGADIGPMRQGGVPLVGQRQDATHYFDFHHTQADTLDKVDPLELDLNVLAMAFCAWAVAESPETLPRST